MHDHQRRPRAVPPAADAEQRRPVRPPMDSGVDALLRRGNQAMNERVKGERWSPSLGETVAEDPFPGAQSPAAAALVPGSYDEIWADVVDIVQHGSFSFLQVLELIRNQTDLPPEDRVRMQEQARQLRRASRP